MKLADVEIDKWYFYGFMDTRVYIRFTKITEYNVRYHVIDKEKVFLNRIRDIDEFAFDWLHNTVEVKKQKLLSLRLIE